GSGSLASEGCARSGAECSHQTGRDTTAFVAATPYNIASIGVTPTPALIRTTGVAPAASVNEPRGALISRRLPARTLWWRKPLARPRSFLTAIRYRGVPGGPHSE